MPDDEDTRAILARRGRFIAIALAGMTTTACGPDLDPRPCLSPMPDTHGQEEPAQDPHPQPCLAPVPLDNEPEPQPCLSVLEPQEDPEES